jgi:hypothetical protein
VRDRSARAAAVVVIGSREDCLRHYFRQPFLAAGPKL